MKKYPSIEQYRNVIRKVKERHDYQGKDENDDPIYKHTTNYPTLKFRGTVKLHGTNAGIVRYSDGRTEFQSRENVLSPEKDNANFMKSMMVKELDQFFNQFTFEESCVIYGEWCGGSIQKGVALNQLEKMFVIFGIKVDETWVSIPENFHDNDNKIYNVEQFPTYEIEINFNEPEMVQNEMIEMTIGVEDECPAGKFFGVSGIGEGIVFTCDMVKIIKNDHDNVSPELNIFLNENLKNGDNYIVL